MTFAVSRTLLAFAFCATLLADPIPVRRPQGTAHAFLRLETLEGKSLANGDLIQTVRGGTVTSRLLFKFGDGSVDDETTVYTQNRTLKMVSDHHLQHGPFFPHQIDFTVLASGKVTSTSTGTDGKIQQTDEQMDLPPDLANGLPLTIAMNLVGTGLEAKVPMLQVNDKPMMVHLVFSPDGTEPFSVGGVARKADRYSVKIELGGVKGVIAPMIGRSPKDFHLWLLGGPAPLLLKAEGQIYAEGPVIRIRPISANFPTSGVTQ